MTVAVNVWIGRYRNPTDPPVDAMVHSLKCWDTKNSESKQTSKYWEHFPDLEAVRADPRFQEDRVYCDPNCMLDEGPHLER